MRALLLVAAAAFAAAPLSAQVVDDFDRPDAGTLGANWTVVEGAGASIVSGRARGNSDNSALIYDGLVSNRISFDIRNVGTSTGFAGGVLGWGTGDNYWVKVQNNGGSSGFDSFGFYAGVNGSAPGSGPFGSLSAPFQTAFVDIHRVGSVVTLTITPDVGAMQVYSYDYGYVPTGTGTGLAFYGATEVDNFGAAPSAVVPEPSTYALLGSGLLGLAAVARRRGRRAA